MAAIHECRMRYVTSQTGFIFGIAMITRRNIIAVACTMLMGSTALHAQNGGPQKDTCFPFTLGEKNEVIAFLRSKMLYPRYLYLFEKYRYSGDEYCWEGHVKQILEKTNPKLLKHIKMDSEAGMFIAYADSKETRSAFLKTLCPIFSDEKKLAEWVKKADRSRIVNQ